MPVLPDIAVVGSATTTADLVARTRVLVGEAVADMFDDNVDIIPALNEGTIKVFSKVDALIRPFSGMTTVGSPLVGGCGSVARWITVRAGTAKLAYVDQLSYLDLPDASGIPTQFCPDMLDASGERVLALYPTPATATAIAGAYYAYPPRLTATQGPAWHADRHYLPCFFAAHIILRKDNLPEEADTMYGHFLDGIAEYKRWLGTSKPPMNVTFGKAQTGEM